MSLYAQKLTHRRHADDIVQEVFLRLCRADQAEVEPRLAQWLYTVCRNRALDVRRRRAYAATTPEGDVGDVLPPISREAPPGDSAARDDSIVHVQEELTRLTHNQQECIRLKFQHELSYKEIGAITGLSVSNVGFLIHTGLKAVRERMRRTQQAQS